MKTMKPAALMAVSLILLLSAFLSGCNPTEGAGNDLHPEKSYKIVEIDDCEYIFVSRRPFSGDMAMAHKGNCKNLLHHHDR